MTFTSNIPATGQSLGQTRDPIRDNFTNYNNLVSQDHIPPNNPSPYSAGQGKHNQVTTPVYVANPVTGLPPTTVANEPKFYAFQDSTALGVIQYSRGPSNAIPTPITNIQSTSPVTPAVTAGSTTNVLDFTGLSVAIFNIYAFDSVLAAKPVNSITGYWTGSAFINLGSLTASIAFIASGNVLQIKNNTASTMSNLYWSLSFERTT